MEIHDLCDLTSISTDSKSFQELHIEAEALLARYRDLLASKDSPSSSAAPPLSEGSEEESTAQIQDDSPTTSQSRESSADVDSASVESLLISLRPPFQDSDFDAGESRKGNGAPLVQRERSQSEGNGSSTEVEARCDDPILDGIPYSTSEDLPKFELAVEMRLCSSCGCETDIQNECCRNCGGVDRSLGVLEAVIAGDLQRVERLLRAKPRIIGTRTSGHKWSLLHMAANGGNPKIVELLLSKGAAVDARATDETTPLHYAAGKGHAKVARALLKHGADPSIASSGKTALDLAEEHGREGVVKLLRGAEAKL